jgi:hypothetical protein
MCPGLSVFFCQSARNPAEPVKAVVIPPNPVFEYDHYCAIISKSDPRIGAHVK